MSGSPTSRQLARAALDQHQQIHFYLDQVSQSLQGLRCGPSDVEPMRRLAAQIEGLTERLREHHQLEEKLGLFRAILEALPQARIEIGRLIKEHERMIEILEMARIHAQCGEPAEADSLCIDLDKFLEMFRKHERAEEKLIREAIDEEIDVLD